VEAREIREQVSQFLTYKENPVPRDLAVNMVLQFLRDHLVSGGKPWMADGMAVLLMPDGTLKNLTLDNQEILDFIHAAGLPLNGPWKQQMGDTLRTGSLPKAKLHGISHYDGMSHCLYLNEWDGHFLRIEGSGAVTRHTNGDFDLLFLMGAAPHKTDLTQISADRALTWTEEDVLIKHVMGVGVFSESTGLQRHHAMNVVIAWLLAVMMKGRVKTVPIPLLNGPSGSRKTAMAFAIGSVITPEGADFRVVSCPADTASAENILINSHGIVCLDEFQNGKSLANLLKSTTTGGVIKRRILFTTGGERTYTPDAVPFLTLNADIWVDEATQRRMLRIAMGQPSMATGGWRGDYFIERDWVAERVREKAWHELVSRLAGSMRLLTSAKAAGREDIAVEHRMSGFWSFVLAIAEQEGTAVLTDLSAAMAAVDASQIAASEMGDDLLELLTEVLIHKKELQRVWITTRVLKAELDSWTMVRSMSLPQGLRTAIQSSFMLHRRLTSSNAYRTRLGFQERERRHLREYWFEVQEQEVEVRS
jgi:hypothetical protein